MADALQSAVVKYGRRVRIYTPVGELIPGMAYLVRRLLENTSNESFIHKQKDHVEPIEQLLSPPIAMTGNGAHARTDPLLPSPQSVHEFHNQPHTNFSLESSRLNMSQAIDQVRAQFGQQIPLMIPLVETLSSEEFVSVNPSRPQEEIARVQCPKPEVIHDIIQEASCHQEAWGMTSPDSRADMLVRAAALMRKRRFELAAWEIFETGKPWREADADVAEAIDFIEFIEFYAEDMRILGKPSRLGHEPGELNHLIWSPRGLSVVISPWNFSLAIPTGMVSATLVTGNVVLFKPSERSLMMAYYLYQILREAGVPENVLYFLPGGPQVGQALMTHPQVHTIAFTGSKEVGLQIMKKAVNVSSDQSHVKHVIAEMGGKNAIIVDETADLDEAVTGVFSSMTGYQGQKCSACSRAIVLESIYDTFVQHLLLAADSLHIGPPEDPTNHMGPMIDERALAKVHEYVQIGQHEGQLVLDRKIDGEGWFQGPVIFTNILQVTGWLRRKFSALCSRS